MIRLHGDVGTEEGAAAAELRGLMATAWPWLETSESDHATIIAGAKCYGQRVQDIDVVVLLDLKSPKATFQPTVPLAVPSGDPWRADRVRVESLCLVIEVKAHSPQNVRFSGAKVEVRYRGPDGEEWHDASEQNHQQVYSLKNTIENRLGAETAPYIVNLLWLRNVNRQDLPKIPHKIIPRKLSWSGILNVVAANMSVLRTAREVLLTATRRDASAVIAKAEALLVERLVPTELDRLRMDRIARAAVDPQWLDVAGRTQLILQGFGGTGKTVRMLALGWKLYEQGRRVLMLTYNVALVADLRRLLTLLDMVDAAGEPCIRVQTVHSFLWLWLRVAGVVEEAAAAEGASPSFASFEPHKDQLLELLRQEALTTVDVSAAMRADAERLKWDCILVDEAQDWPPNERDLLHRLYSPARLVVADGRDQLVRGSRHCDWGEGVPETKRVRLHEGLRMKPNLATFANALASKLGLAGWEIGSNAEASGGRVIVVEGAYADARAHHAAIMELAEQAGNKPVDCLVCVPPQLVEQRGSAPVSSAAELLKSWGHQLWDGIAQDARRAYPTDVEQLRLLQYESCRGLEGWVVFALRIDQFFDHKLKDWNSASVAGGGGGGNGAGAMADPQLARRAAARWLMIPCTRAIDTLVLHVGAEASSLKDVLQKVRAAHPDIVEWVRLEPRGTPAGEAPAAITQGQSSDQARRSE